MRDLEIENKKNIKKNSKNKIKNKITVKFYTVLTKITLGTSIMTKSTIKIRIVITLKKGEGIFKETKKGDKK